MEKFVSGNTLYYPGCLTKFVAKDIQNNYERIFQIVGLDYIILKDKEVCCGSPVYNAGYDDDFRRLIEKNYQLFKDHGVTRIVTNCPACYKVFSQDYPSHHKGWDLKIEHATEIIWEAIRKGKLQLEKGAREKITYHDPCHLGRYYGVYDEPRKILEELGYEVVEMEESKEEALCCGGGGGVRANYPELSNEIVKARCDQALKTRTNILVTACPLCLMNLKEGVKKRMKVWDIGMVLAKHSVRVSKVGLDISSEFKSEFLWD